MTETTAERLHRIKVEWVLEGEDVDWLIQQAERVHLLEKQVASEKAHKLTYRKVAERYRNENKKLREALPGE